MRYRHFCYDWDELEIDETCPEFAFCTCYDGDEEVKIIQEKLYENIFHPHDRKT